MSEPTMERVQETSVAISSKSLDGVNRGFRERGPQGLFLSFFNKIKKWIVHRWVFFCVVLLPTLLMGVYLWGIAAPQYVSETHFLVRGKSNSGSTLGGLGSLLDSGHGGTQDTYAIQDYMMSRDALRMLISKADLRGVFNRPGADFFAKFPSLFTRNDFESFYDFYRGHVKAQIDEETGISHLTVRTFSAQDSQYVAQILLDAGEKLVNEMNARQRYNTLHAAQVELDASLKELHDIEMQLARYRYENQIIDPMKQATPMIGTAFSLESTLSMIEAEKKQLDRIAPDSPLRKVYAQRINSIKAQMERAQEHITGEKGSSVSLVPKLLGYDELEEKKVIVEKKIAAEASALEVAKAQANRQMLYVTVVAQPDLPDYPAYPRNFATIVVTFLTMLMLFAIGSLLVSGAKEHALK
ncbi:capsule biosynthesis protein [Bombella sp. TMW 2.2543]|uniref:Capsule biosynthesis protein n=1 Tax=Bombella pluederhausensis TaxID=2967336 RepID=A0ABT3WHC4_9PROT|nr:capsule biosynthesis protein [Bombella pluederhausensis]MCX5617625.1 capsule biosynthesis protein [Bombella pluederhausensis]